MPRAPICCAASAPRRTPRKATGERWHSRPTIANGDFSNGVCVKFSRPLRLFLRPPDDSGPRTIVQEARSRGLYARVQSQSKKSSRVIERGRKAHGYVQSRTSQPNIERLEIRLL